MVFTHIDDRKDNIVYEDKKRLSNGSWPQGGIPRGQGHVGDREAEPAGIDR
jgi:hypothetical protein